MKNKKKAVDKDDLRCIAIMVFKFSKIYMKICVVENEVVELVHVELQYCRNFLSHISYLKQINDSYSKARFRLIPLLYDARTHIIST